MIKPLPYHNVLLESCEILSGVGPQMKQLLEKCGIRTLQDLLFQLPYRYQDRTRITAIRDLRLNDWAVIEGCVVKTEVSNKRRPSLICEVEDKSGRLRLRFFHYHAQLLKNIKTTPLIRAFGEVRFFGDHFEMIHPEIRLLQACDTTPVEENLTPIYPTTQGLSQTKRRKLIQEAKHYLTEQPIQLEWLKEKELNLFGFMPLEQALSLLHAPPPETSIVALEQGEHPALKRLIFEEFLAHQLSMQFAKKKLLTFKAPACALDNKTLENFVHTLPFNLTHAQKKVSREVAADLAQSVPMLRLVQGDVGAGKTMIAILAAIQVIQAGYQVALMAPTEILSEQHAKNISTLVASLDIRTHRLQGKMSAKEKKEALQAIASGDCQWVIGTHALFQEAVEFHNLGLVIIDEQHRFGVEQRLLLQQKGQKAQWMPHQLLMTATPIPRTLAMAHYAHLDLSILDELPPGRTPIKTAVLASSKREEVIARLSEAAQSGTQIYWVCPLIEESDKQQLACATETLKMLQQALPHITIALIHGRMVTREKEMIMQAFKANKVQLLVATTVIEVGVDVPNASLMIIENAERLGLAQLHQLRGRVGRGNTQAYCVLLYEAPLSAIGRERLLVMRDSTDGFYIAEKDLALRGSGEILGTRQTGYRQFRVGKIDRDHLLLQHSKDFAKTLVNTHPELAEQVCLRWLGNYADFLKG
jgi:ATP-dependent DNA helicase RecG